MRNSTLRTVFQTRAQASSETKDSISLLQSLFTGVDRSTQATLAEQQGTGSVLGTLQASLLGNANTGPLTAGQGSSSSQNSGPLPSLFSDLAKNLDRLRAASETQSTLLGTNTQALTSNTAAQSIKSAITSAGSNAAGGLLGSALGSIPLISTLFKLFGGGSSTLTPAPEKYSLPPTQNFEAAAAEATPGVINPLSYNSYGLPRTAMQTDLPYFSSMIANSMQTPIAGGVSQPVYGVNNSVQAAPTNPPSSTPSSTQVTVQVQAMDSRSFMDRSHDIAQAVREAMLNMHSINDVVNDL